LHQVGAFENKRFTFQKITTFAGAGQEPGNARMKFEPGLAWPQMSTDEKCTPPLMKGRLGGVDINHP
jgi:hypothetical protein